MFTKLKQLFSSHKKMIAVMAISIVIYTLIMLSTGIFGTAAKAAVLPVVLIVLKWLAVALGYAVAVFLPVRIIHALQLREQTKKLIELDEAARMKAAAEQQEELRKRAVEEAILKTYYKEEDDV